MALTRQRGHVTAQECQQCSECPARAARWAAALAPEDGTARPPARRRPCPRPLAAPGPASPARPRRRGPGGRGRRRRREVSGEVGSRPGTGAAGGDTARQGGGVSAPSGRLGPSPRPRGRWFPAEASPRSGWAARPGLPPPPAPPPRPGPKPGLPGPPCPALGRVPTRLAVLGRRRRQATLVYTCPARGRQPGQPVRWACGPRAAGPGSRRWNPGWSPAGASQGRAPWR